MPIPTNHIFIHNNVAIHDQSTLWRYMDLQKYNSLLSEASLFFCALPYFEDKHEGCLTEKDFDQLIHLKNCQGNSPDEVREWVTRERGRFFVNCWCLSDHESAALWKIYGGQGKSISIKACFKALKETLPSFVNAGPVIYINQETDLHYFRENIGIHKLALWKRREFNYETEVRLLFHQIDLSSSFDSWKYARSTQSGNGFCVTAPAEDFIEEVIVCPDADDIFLEQVSNISRKYGISKVTKSCLGCGPSHM
jgi:hypothetical protein